MALFRRRPSRSASVAPAIAEFWAWWPEVGRQLAETSSDELPEDLGERLMARIQAIHPELSWSVREGARARRALIVSSGGHAELRGVAERWLRAAPEAGPDWEFLSAFPPAPDDLDAAVDFEGHELDLGHVSLGLRVDGRRARVDITAYHPDFAFLPDEARAVIAAHVLTAALGEDQVARWIGAVNTVTERPLDALPPSSLPAVVDQLAQTHAAPSWLTGEGRTARGHPALIAVRFPLRRVDFPLYEQHIVVGLPYQHSGPDRLPVDPSGASLRGFADTGLALVPGAVLVAHETGDDQRVFHLYADPESGAAAAIEQLAAGWSEGRARVSTTSDPSWAAIEAYMY
ncbi:MAG: DUF695 domain-containing protein [Streptosporangiales bacterium]|nr:DUF695 domain-containing protein [Streptosporangiales bacterium]